MAKRKLQAKVERDPKRRVPSRLHDIKGAPTAGTPKQIAIKTLKQLAPRLKIPPDLKSLRYDKGKKTVLGDTCCFNSVTTASQFPAHGSALTSIARAGLQHPQPDLVRNRSRSIEAQRGGAHQVEGRAGTEGAGDSNDGADRGRRHGGRRGDPH